ncbi:MAG TPA: hypothetical protein VHV77_00395 [Pirellulales bacterium]|jgi:hypothetical protein|nr:hypothetical protein [Pirellulales bacterium]
MKFSHRRFDLFAAGAATLLLLAAPGLRAADVPNDMRLVFSDDFEHGADHWEPTDPAAWKIVTSDGGHVYSQYQESKFKPPYRSPFNFALVKDVTVGSFVFDARALSTKPDYNHRDMCVIFGYQDPAHFYYVHLGKKTDDHANQIFIVNEAPRVKISTKTSPGTDWDDAWHEVRVVRKIDDASIAIYFDDMQTPVMEATDKTFTSGRVGIGTFDDIGNWDDVKLYAAPRATETK